METRASAIHTHTRWLAFTLDAAVLRVECERQGQGNRALDLGVKPHTPKREGEFRRKISQVRCAVASLHQCNGIEME